MTLEAPVVRVQMRIRRPVREVFDAFVDPAITTRFWFTSSSGPLSPGAEVTWTWEMYGASSRVRVEALERDRRIRIAWDDPPVPVEWTFTPRDDDTTLVEIATWGFHGDRDAVVAQALDNTGGFSFVLAGAKAWLEHGVELRLVEDHQPDAHVPPTTQPQRP